MYQVTQNEGFLNLSLNENYFSFCRQEVLKIENLNRYPDTQNYRKIELEAAKLYKVDSKNILLTNGSDDGIFLLQQCFANKSILITDPTFSMYENYAKNLGINVIKQQLNDNLEIDVDLLIEYINTHKPCLTFIPNPNSPTGTMLEPEQIEKILKTGSKVVIDEAYIEFSGKESSIQLIQKYTNLIILRTLSKFYGCASIRIGFVISHNINEVTKFQAPFSVSSLNAQIALSTLEYINNNKIEIEKFTQNYITERKLFIEALIQKSNVKKVYTTETNFVLFEVENIEEVLENFRKKRFLVKDFSSILPKTIRLSLADKTINQDILRCI
jgi:histidinol-phosphate aminotransferase